jgi:hypothetical protein
MSETCEVWDKGALISKDTKNFLNILNIIKSAEPIMQFCKFTRVDGYAITV